MKNKSSVWQIISGFLLIGTSGYLLFLLLKFLTAYIQLLSPNIVAAIIAGLVTVIGYFISRNLERKKIVEQQIREKKLPVYEDFITFLFKVLQGSLKDEPVSSIEMEQFMTDFNKKSIVWLSDSSLSAYISWKYSISQQSSDASKEENTKSLFALENLLYEFRKDIGHNNKGLKRGDILRLFVTDIDEYLR